MADIVERLRLIDPTLELRYCEDVTKLHEIGQWCHEGADEIERLREALSAMADVFKATEASAQWALSEVERLREALRTIADTPAWGYPDKWEDTPTELRHFARAALGEKE